jgi:hypothetical protein
LFNQRGSENVSKTTFEGRMIEEARAARVETQDLERRAEEALRRIREGIAPMRIPADPCDADLVIADLLAALRGEP